MCYYQYPPHVDPLFRVVAPPVRIFTPAVVFTNKTNIHTRENEISSEELQTFLVVGVTCDSTLGGVPPKLMGSPLGDTRYWGENYWGNIWYPPPTPPQQAALDSNTKINLRPPYKLLLGQNWTGPIYFLSGYKIRKSDTCNEKADAITFLLDICPLTKNNITIL